MQTALIVPVAEAEPVVGRHRATLDRSAAWGVPAHVTVLSPFLPPDRIDDRVLAVLRDTLGAAPGFTVSFTRVDWFADTTVWLAPEPDQPFRDLTNALCRRFPENPPYGGEFADVVPHLTIGYSTAGDDAGRQALAQAAEEVLPHLPIMATIGRVRLIAGESGRVAWRALHEFPLRERPVGGAQPLR